MHDPATLPRPCIIEAERGASPWSTIIFSAAPAAPQPARRPTIEALAGRLAIALAAWIVYLSASPLEAVPLADAAERVRVGLADPTVARALLHTVIMGGFGATLALATGPRPRGALLILAGFALSLELLQGFAPSRHPRGGDLLMNLVASAGAWGLLRAVDQRLRISPQLGERSVALARAAAAASVLLAGASILVYERDLSFTGWDPSFGLAVGDELSGTRRWDGVLEGLAIYARPPEDLDPRELARVPFDGPGLALRRGLGALVLHDRIVSPRVLEPRAPELREALADRSTFTVELIARSAIREQGGPARLVTFSRDHLSRNFTVAQQLDTLVLRVRTPVSGDNGIRPDAHWPGVFLDSEPRHLLVGFARGRSRAFLNGVELEPGAQHIASREPRIGRIPIGRPAWAIALFFLPWGLLAQLGWRDTRLPIRVAAEAVLGGGCVATATALGNAVHGSVWDPTLPALAMLAVPLSDLFATVVAATSRTTRAARHRPSCDS